MTPTPVTPPRRPLPGFGVKGRLGVRGRLVRGVIERGFARILWTEPGPMRPDGTRDKGKRRTESFPDTAPGRAEARAFGEAVYERLGALAAGIPIAPQHRPLTVRELWQRFATAHMGALRPKSAVRLAEQWQKFETFHGPHRMAGDLTLERMDEYATALRARHVINQVRHYVSVVRRVYAFGITRDLIPLGLPAAKVPAYSLRIGRDEKTARPAEYTRAQATAILAQFDPRSSRTWRAYVLTVLLAYAGPRVRAALHLTWDDVDFAAETIRWRAELDKMGEDRTQPVPGVVMEALWVAYGWRLWARYDGPFVFFRPGAGRRAAARKWGEHASKRRALMAPPKPDAPLTYSGYYKLLRDAETAAKVRHLPLMGAHSFRRLVGGDALTATGGNLKHAAAYIGDRDLRTFARSYLRERDNELRDVADALGGGEDAT